VTAAVIIAAVLAAAAIAAGIRVLHKAGRLERLLEAHEAEWSDEQIERLRLAIEEGEL
jgi:hypothetical protein